MLSGCNIEILRRGVMIALAFLRLAKKKKKNCLGLNSYLNSNSFVFICEVYIDQYVEES